MLTTHYRTAAETPSDIFRHIPVLYKYALDCNHITEFGTRKVVSSWAFAYAKPQKIILYDLIFNEYIENFISICKNNNIEVVFKKENTRSVSSIEETDLLFIDTEHSYEQVKKELTNFNKVRKYIIFHDTETFGKKDYDGNGKGIMPAIEEFLNDNTDWEVEFQTTINNGLTVIRNKRNTTKETNLLVGIPILGNTELFENTIKTLLENTKKYNLEFFCINNTENTIERKKLYSLFDTINCKIFDINKNIGVSCSWNRIIFNALSKNKTPYILSTDLVFNSQMDDIFDYVETFQDRVNLIKGYNFFSVPKNIIREIGWFDENIYPAYSEDCDYSYRIKNIIGDFFIKNVPLYKDIEHIGSQTLKNQNSDPKDVEFIKSHGKFIKNYYKLKWGDSPGKEIFNKPFNI